jgi:hypothetical protein
MLLKKPEIGTLSSPKKKKMRNLTLVLCLLIIGFFGYRLTIIYRHSKIAPVVADSTATQADSPVTTNTSQAIDTNTDSTIDKANANGPLTSVFKTLPNVGHELGIAMGSQLTGLSDADLEKEVSGMQSMGITLVRFDIDWGFVQQGSATAYDWSKYDRIINSLNAHHIQGLGIIDNTPPWARAPGCNGGAHCPPNNPNDFAKFAAAVVNRYQSKGMHYWEIWNEENDYDFWATKSDCVAYTALLKATYPAIKKADPLAYVITGGLAQVATTDVNIAPLQFLQCMYDQGGKGSFDAVGFHPYTFPQFPSANNTNGWAQMSLTSPSVRSIMTANGDSAKQVWITEVGAPTNGPDAAWYVSEDDQSKMLTDAINLYKSYDWTGPLLWYTYRDGGTTTNTNENFFGLIRNDYSQKPAYQTMKNFISAGIQ